MHVQRIILLSIDLWLWKAIYFLWNMSAFVGIWVCEWVNVYDACTCVYICVMEVNVCEWVYFHEWVCGSACEKLSVFVCVRVNMCICVSCVHVCVCACVSVPCECLCVCVWVLMCMCVTCVWNAFDKLFVIIHTWNNQIMKSDILLYE